MDEFVRNVKSQVIPLSTLDMASSFVNIQFYYYYKNNKPASSSQCKKGSSNSTFMPSDLLYASFYKALLEFPILAGHLVQKEDCSGTVVVDKHNLNLPEFGISYSSVDFADLEATRFSWSALPDGVASVGAFPTANSNGVIKLLNVHIVRLKSNSGLVMFVSIPHYVVDGIGYSAFVCRWAELSKQMHQCVPASKPAEKFVFDRRYIEQSLPASGKELDSATYCTYTAGGYLSSWVSWLSPQSRGKIYENFSSLVGLAGHVFHISQTRLEMIRQQSVASSDYNANDDNKSNQKATQRLSDNDIITALVSMVVAQGVKSNIESTTGKGAFRKTVDWFVSWLSGKQVRFSTMFVVDPRPRLEHRSQDRLQRPSTCYTGNIVLIRTVNNPLELVHAELDSSALGDVAHSIRAAVNNCDAYFAKQVVDTINKRPSEFAGGAVSGCTNMQRVVVTNQSRFPLYDADFGSGTPMWISPLETFYDKFVSILPQNPHSSKKGYDIFISADKRIMAGILCNKTWHELVDMVY
ncbi:transferase [Coemansia spiralis]|nr:transferase [Coemansia spiralis]